MSGTRSAVIRYYAIIENNLIKSNKIKKHKSSGWVRIRGTLIENYYSGQSRNRGFPTVTLYKNYTAWLSGRHVVKTLIKYDEIFGWKCSVTSTTSLIRTTRVNQYQLLPSVRFRRDYFPWAYLQAYKPYKKSPKSNDFWENYGSSTRVMQSLWSHLTFH